MYNIRLAKDCDIKYILEIMEEAYDNFDDKSWYYIEGTYNKYWIRSHLSSEGYTLVAEDSVKIVGFLIVRIPSKNEDNLGIGMFPDIENVAHIETTAVSISARGNGLMRSMLERAESLLPSKYTHLMGTVYPDNLYSLSIFESLGYKVVSEVDCKYGNNLPRFVLLKERF